MDRIMDYTDMAASAYRSYAASTGNKNFRGEPMLAFEELPPHIRVAWEAAIRQVDFIIRNNLQVGDDLKEMRWLGWLPPDAGA